MLLLLLLRSHSPAFRFPQITACCGPLLWGCLLLLSLTAPKAQAQDARWQRAWNKMYGPRAPKSTDLLRPQTTGPEQDCANALNFCRFGYENDISYSGTGNQQELNPTLTCLREGERNGVWFVIDVAQGGTFGFDIRPTSIFDDYDFALYYLDEDRNETCADIRNMLPTRCNYSADAGTTGLLADPTDSFQPMRYDAFEENQMPGLVVEAGQRFMLLVNNYSSTTQGFELTATGSAVVGDIEAPEISLDPMPRCISERLPSLTLRFSKLVRCNTVQAEDFVLTDPEGHILEPGIHWGYSCEGESGFASSISIQFQRPYEISGIYSVTHVGDVRDNCNNTVDSGAVAIAEMRYRPTNSIPPEVRLDCLDDTLAIISQSFSLPDSLLAYDWSGPSGFLSDASGFVLTPPVPGTYSLTVSALNGCDTTLTTEVLEPNLDGPVWINPVELALCEADTLRLEAIITNPSLDRSELEYAWSGPGGFTSTEPAPIVHPAPAGLYSLNGTYGLCTFEADSNLAPLPPPQKPLLNDRETLVCVGTSHLIQNLRSYPQGVSYHWRCRGCSLRNDPNNHDWQEIVEFDQPGQAEYGLSVSLAPHCPRSEENTRSVTVYRIPETPAFDAPEYACRTQPLTLETLAPPDSNLTYEWSCSNCTRLDTSRLGICTGHWDSSSQENDTLRLITYAHPRCRSEAATRTLRVLSPPVSRPVNVPESCLDADSLQISFQTFYWDADNQIPTGVRIYSQPTGGLPIGEIPMNAPGIRDVVVPNTSDVFTPNPDSRLNDTLYSETYTILDGCVSERQEVPVLFSTPPASPIAAPVSRCGPGSVTISAQTPQDVFYNLALFSTPSGGSPITIENFTTEARFTLPGVSASSTYFVETQSLVSDRPCPNSARVPVPVTVHPLPQAPEAPDVARCGPGPFVFSATIPGIADLNRPRVALYADAGGTQLLDEARQAPFTLNPAPAPPYIDQTTRFYLRAFDDQTGCQSAELSPVTASIRPTTAPPQAGISVRCGLGRVMLTAAAPDPGTQALRFYESPTAPTPLAEDREAPYVYRTPLLTQPQTYYVSAINAEGCESGRIPAVAQVTDLLRVQLQTQPATSVNSGEVRIIVRGGYPPYTFTLGSQTQSSPVFTGLAPGRHLLWVRDAGQCAATEVVEIEQTCGAPQQLEAEVLTGQGIFLRWAAVDGAQHYVIRYRRQGATDWKVLPEIYGNRVQLDGLAPEWPYEAQVQAVCGYGASAFTPITFETPICNSVNFVQALNTTYNSSEIVWSPMVVADYYEFSFREQGSSVWRPTEQLTQTVRRLENLEPGTTYDVRLRSICVRGSVISDYVYTSFTTRECRPVSGLHIENLTTAAANLLWQPVAGATLYEVRWRRVGTQAWARNTTSATRATVYPLQRGQEYEAQVEVLCSRQTSPPQRITFRTPENYRSAAGERETGAFRVYPNPAQQRVQLSYESPRATPAKLTLLTAAGRIIRSHEFDVQAGMNVFTLPLEALPAGMYLLQWQPEGRAIETQTLIVR